jgi:hypothetical protein
MLAAGRQHKYILCITDAFTKYALITAVENKEAEMVAKAIFSKWFCKFSILAQIHTDGRKEFVNKLSNKLFTLLNIQHTKTSPAHPQCNAQVEVFNKTVKKYLASFIDDTTLDWENFLPALVLSYNTSYHSTIATTPYKLLFGERPRLPSFPNLEIQRLHYGESASAERYQLLQKIQFLAKNIANDNSAKIKDNFDKSAFPHDFKINDLVWFEEFAPLGKNPKLTPKWQGPAKITEISDTNARLLLPNGKTKVYNVMRLKKFFALPTNSNGETDAQHSDLDFKSEPKITGPVTRAMKKLMQQKEATEIAISILCDLTKQHCSMCEWEQECSDNLLLFDPVFARCYISERKNWLINKQSMCAKCKLQLGEHLIDYNAQNAANFISAASDSLQNLISKQFFDEAMSKDLIKIQQMISDAQNANDNLINAHTEKQSDEIFLINENLHEPLLNIANKLLGRQHLNFEQLTTSEQELWNKFEKSDIYEFLTGERDTVPEFCNNWLTFSASPKVMIDAEKIAARLTPVPSHPLVQATFRSFSASAPASPSRTLRDRKTKIDYRALHLGQTIKQDIQQAAQEVKQNAENLRKQPQQSWLQGLFRQSSNPLLPHLSHRDLHLILPGHSGPQNRWGLSSSGSGTENAGFQFRRA